MTPLVRSHRLLFAALCCVLALVQLYAFHWGVITPDSVVQYAQALSGHYDDWHPPVTAWLWRQLLHLGSGGAPFLLLDIMLYWGALGLIADQLRVRHGWAAAAWVILIGLLPIGFGQVGAILKDPLLACLMLMAAALLIRREGGGPRWLALIAVPLILVASATRANAPFAALPMLLLAFPRGWVMRPLKFVASATVGLILLAASGWAINEAMLRPHHAHAIYSLVNFDLAGIIAHGGANGYPSLSDGQARTLTVHCYDPRLYGWQDEEGCALPEDSIADYVARTGESPIGIWLNAVIASPGAYLRHRIAHVNWNWRLMPATIPNDAVYMMSEPNALGLHFKDNGLTRVVSRAGWAMAWTPLGRPASWIALALGLLIAASQLPSRRIVVALAASALLYGGAYALVSVSSDLRYNVWTMLAALLGLAIVVAERAALSGRRMALAVAPVTVVMLLELAALVSPMG